MAGNHRPCWVEHTKQMCICMIHNMKNIRMETSELPWERPKSSDVILDAKTRHTSHLIGKIRLQMYINYFTVPLKNVSQTVSIKRHAKTSGLMDIPNQSNFHDSSFSPIFPK